jgi:hypothetical protein
MRGQDLEGDLVKLVASYRHDPLGFIQMAFPWGKKGSELEDQIGPMFWQADVCIEVSRILTDPSAVVFFDNHGNPVFGNGKGRIAVASGKGIGKSCLVSWLILWALCTTPDTRIIVTAGTEPQLRTKTWPELAKWYRLLICKHWFRFTATSMYAAEPEREKTWRADSQPWNESNPEAFAGLHNQGKRIVVIFDEASQIADPICQTTDTGIFTDKNTEVLWFMFGNPTRGDGFFRHAFGRMKDKWIRRNIDSRSVSITDKEDLQAQVDALGEDSDLVRSMIRGLFPRVSSTQFISNEAAAAARKREVQVHLHEPLIIGVDVGRFGGAKSVIAFRKGRDARSIPWIVLAGSDTMEVAARAAEAYRMYKADAIFVDAGGVGAGVADRLRAMGVPVRDVQFGGKPDRAQLTTDGTRYTNKRSEMWGVMKENLPTMAIPDLQDLEDELSSVLYGYRNDMEIQLERKQDMQRRGVASPDLADGLALTFAYPVLPNPDKRGGGIHEALGGNQRANTALTEYDLYA